MDTNKKRMGGMSRLALAAALVAGGVNPAFGAPEPVAPGATGSMAPGAPSFVAPGAPGQVGTWSYAGKTGIGTAYHPYGAGEAPSRVWFSLAQGVVTETMYGLIHEVQLKDLKFAIKGDGFLDVEDSDTVSETSYLDQDAAGRPLSLAYKVINRARNGAYEVEKHIFTDPDGDVLFMRVLFRSLKGGVTPYLLVDPQMAGTAGGDSADAADGVLHASEGNIHLVVKAAQPVSRLSVGFVGVSDGLTQLRRDGALTHAYTSTGGKSGNVALTAELAPVAAGGGASYDFVVGFGHSRNAAVAAADASLGRGYAAVLAHYNGGRQGGGAVGWEDYLAGLDALPRLAAVAEDGGRLVHASALVLKAQEDKTHPGALIASLSTPWGDTLTAAKAATGYRAVWPRDFYQCAMALLALGDHQTPLAALRYLRTVQVGAGTPGNHGATGWFLQKTHVDGTPEWVGVQLDQTAMPIMLAWKLWRAGLVDAAQAADLYHASLKPAADFLVDGGTAGIGWNKGAIHPPLTQQERWEEQGGYSPSTTAAVITGLIAAADIAEQAGDRAAAQRYRQAADAASATVEAHMLTTTGALGGIPYYVRIAPAGTPDAHTPLAARNGQPALPQDQYLDGGFLELVRYGVRRPDFPAIRDSLAVLDDTGLPENLRVRYDFTFPGEQGSFPGWRRYGNDGYGENAVTGGNYAADGHMDPRQRGRVWPLLTGERGHYELAADLARPGGAGDADIDSLRHTYVRGMELFANQGLMIPEQVWDGVGSAGGHDWRPGMGTDSATPLAWSHAEYVKLLRSLADRQVWDSYAPVAARYAAP